MYKQSQVRDIQEENKKLRILSGDLTSLSNTLFLKLSFIDLNHFGNLFLIGNDKAILKKS